MTARRLSEKNEARLMEMAAELHEMAKAEGARIISLGGYCDWDEPTFPSVHLHGVGTHGFRGGVHYHEPSAKAPDGEDPR
jgi:hypothetical protein